MVPAEIRAGKSRAQYPAEMAEGGETRSQLRQVISNLPLQLRHRRKLSVRPSKLVKQYKPPQSVGAA